MLIRKATEQDVPEVLEVFKYARKFMAEHGNPTQWGDGYPPAEFIYGDIANGTGYVFENDQGEICGYFAFIIGEDKTYLKIYDGAWLNDELYGTIHRIAGNGKGRGLLKACVEYCSQFVPNLRIDTHNDNIVMQNDVAKNGFTKC